MFFLKLVARNVFRARLRSTLTIVGLVIAVLAFGLLQTVVRAWYAGADAASATRLIARNAISLTFSMPVHYREKIRAVPGVTSVAVSNWFGGIYKEPKNFFAQFAVDAQNYFPLYPEFVFDPVQYQDFLRDRLATAFPDDAVLGEEGGGSDDAARTWVLDPIDGTFNFLKGIPCWGVVAAYVVDGRTELGLTYDPVGDELFTARRGHGAFRNGARIRVSGNPGVDTSCLALAYSFRQPKET